MSSVGKFITSSIVVAAMAVQAQATLVTFTGGTVTRLDSSTETTNNTVVWDNVDYYEEGGYRFDFLPNSAGGFSTNVGNYYGVGNDVIHAHWATGNFGTVTSMEITQILPGTFDLNYFTLTSNTDLGGGPASGNELAYVQGFVGNVPTGAPVLLPSEDWGFPATQVALGSAFDAVDRVVFTVMNNVDCFGMDDFYINEVPEPASLGLMAIGFGGLVMRRRRLPS